MADSFTGAERQVIAHEEALASGRFRFWWMATIWLGLSAVVACLMWWQGQPGASRSTIRFGITVFLMVFLFRGHTWARWFAAFCCGLAGVLASYYSATSSTFSGLVLWGSSGVTAFTFTSWLLKGPLRIFLENQRVIRKRIKAAND